MSNIHGVGIEHFKKWNERNKKLKIKEILPLSYSQLTDFAFNRAGWALRRIFGYEFPTNAAAVRGSAVESGLNMLFNGLPLDDYVRDDGKSKKGVSALVIEQFLDNVKNIQDKNITTELNNTVALLQSTWMYFQEKKFKLLDYQQKIEFTMLDIPIIGYTDFHFEDEETKEDFYIDLKTTKRKPNKLGLSHAMQQSFYAKATNARQELLYAIVHNTKNNIDTEMLPMAVKDTKTPLLVAEHMIKAMSNYLSSVETVDDVRNSIVPDPDDWRWEYPKGDKSRIKARKEVWGF